MAQYRPIITGRKAVTGGATTGILSLFVIYVVTPEAMELLIGLGISIDEQVVSATLIGQAQSIWVSVANVGKFIWRGKVRPWIVKKGLLPEIKQKNEVKV